jgi:hypothetical protein
MQDVENNLDELFRKSADEYPLKASQDDWDRIAPLLLRNQTVTIAEQRKRNIKKYGSLLLLLFLFLYIVKNATKDSLNKTETSALNKQPEKKAVPDKIGNINKETGEVYQKRGNQKQPITDEEHILKQNQQLIKNKTEDQRKGNFIHKIDSKFGDKGSKNKHINISPGINGKVFQDVESKENGITVNNLFKQIDSVGHLADEAVLEKTVSDTQIGNPKESMGIEKGTDKILKTEKKRRNDIYLGIVAGPSFSQVKNQGLRKPGFDIGILAGYQINSKVSFEIGLLFDKKYYFSNGEYFDMSKINSSMPAGMTVLSLEGSSSVFEIPLKVKYNLPTNTNRYFYFSAGISTYIITNEFNKYQAVINGTQQSITGKYDKASRYLTGALDLSLGYENRVGRLARMRIEPYLQIPLRGIGVGSLPVMTAGVHLGFTRVIR